MGFAENLHVLMVEHDLPGVAIAEIAGVTSSAVSSWQSGTTPRRAPVERLCKYFGLSYDELMGDASGLAAKKYGRVAATRNGRPLSLTAEEDRLISIYRALKPALRSRLVGFAEGLAASAEPVGGSNQIPA